MIATSVFELSASENFNWWKISGMNLRQLQKMFRSTNGRKLSLLVVERI